MKRLSLSIVLIVFMLVAMACGANETNENENNLQDELNVENESPTQAELEAKLKEEAVQANFVELNSGEAEKDKKVFASGEVSLVIKEGALGSFVLQTQEEDGFGIYTVENFALGSEVQQGEEVTVYGVYAGKADDGTPKITATIVE